MKPARRRVEVNLEELDRVLEGARQAPLSEADYDKLKEALHTLAGMLAPPNLLDTGFRRDRWRMWAASGSPVGEPTLFVIVLGSTGTVAEYERLPTGAVCQL